MDPTTTTTTTTTSTTVQPPSSPPHTPTNAIIHTTDLNNFNNNHHQPKTISRNMEHFKTLMVKLSRELMPAHQPLIETRFDDVFSDEILVPDHPPYNDMILTALWELNSEGGTSSVEAISDFIIKEYHELPWAHSTILNHHLTDLCSKGKIYMTQDKCYHRTKPLPIYSPCDHLPSNDIPYLSPSSSPSSSTSDSTCSSPNSSTSDSTCSSPSSSSTSFFWGPEGRGRKRIQVRDSGRGRGRARGGGRGRPRKMLQVGQRGSSCGKIQAARRWGRPSKTDKIGEESQIDEDQVDVRVVKAKTTKLEEHAQVTEDQNEVMGMEIEQGVIRGGAEKQQNQSENNNNAVVGTWLSVEDQTDVSEEENLPCEQLTVGEKYRLQKDYNVRWIGRLEYIHRKGECVKQRGSESRQHARNEQRQPCEQFVERTKEQDHERKQCNVIWIGRRVRKLKEAARDPFEEQSDDDVTGPEDDLNDAEVDELVEQSQQKIETEETNAEHNRTEENQQSDIVEKHNFGGEQVTTVPYEGRNRVGMEPVLEVHMTYEQDSVMMQCEVEVTVANVGKQLADTVGQNRSKEQPKKRNEEECQPHEQHIGGDTEQKILEKQVEIEATEDNEADEQTDYLAEEQVETKGQSSEPRDDITEELIYPQEQCVEMTEYSLTPFREDQLKNGEAELAEERPQQEEQQTTLTQKEIDSEVQQEQYPHMIEEKNQPSVEKDGLQDKNNVLSNENIPSLGCTVGRGVQSLKEAARDPIEEQSDDVTGLKDDFSDAQADEQSKQEIEKEGTNAEHNQTEENQQSDMSEKQILREERVTSVIDDKNLQCQRHDRVVMEPVLEVQMAGEQDLVMTQYEAEVTVASVGRPFDDTVEVQNRPEEQLKKGKEEELQTHEQQKGGDTEQKILEKQVEIESAEYTEANEQNHYLTEEQVETIERSSEPQQEEPQTKVNEKEYMLMVDSDRQQAQGVEMIGDQNQPCIEKDVLQDNLVGMEPVLEVQMADEQESVIMQYEAQGAVASVETAEKTKAEQQNNYLTVEQDETKGHSAELHDDITEELIHPPEQCIEMAAISLQSCEEDQLKIGEAEITEERSQEEEQQPKVIRKEMDSEVQQEQCFDMIEEKNQPCIVKDVLQEDKDGVSSENIASSGSTIDGSIDFSCNSSDHKLQEEPRQPLRQGLRSSCKKEEATPTAKNQLEEVTPVRRVLRSHKSVSEAAKINEIPDHSKEQPEHSERTRSSKRKSIIPEAEPVSNLRRTRRTGL